MRALLHRGALVGGGGNERGVPMSTRTPAKAIIPVGASEFGRRHGNAASTGTYEAARGIVRGVEQGSDVLPPAEMPSRNDAPDMDWPPRPRTADELRARFQDGYPAGTGATRGDPIGRGGRRLTDFDLDEQEERLRMPEPMPASWLSPVQPQPPSAAMRQLTGAALGLTLGLAIAVPAVLWQKGRIDPISTFAHVAENFGLAAASPKAAVMTTETREPTVEVVRATPRAVAVPGVEVVMPKPVAASPEMIAASASVATLKPAAVELTPAQIQAAKAEGLMDDARRLMGDGDFRAARSVLEDQAVAAMPTARFLLAETYDPNYLAARGVRSVRAEVPRAVELYREALDGGIEAARQRISALRP